MRKAYLLFLLFCLSFKSFAATWYSDPAGSAVNTLTNWYANAAGTGANPATFATAGDIWIIQSVMTIGATTWTLGGTLQFNSNRLNKTAAGATTINIGGDLVLTAATRIQTGGGAGNVIINLKGNLSLTGTSFITNGNVGVSYNYINFTNTSSTMASPQTITWTSTGASLYTGLNVNAGCVVQLNSNVPLPQNSDVGEIINGTLVCGTYVMSSGGTNAFTVNSGASFYTANNGGINGSVTSMSSTSFSGGANYIFNGAAAQVTGTLLPAAITGTGSVTVNNSGAGVTLSQSTSFASGSNLNLQNGAFINTAANLSMAAGANVNRDNGTLAASPTTYTGVNLTYENLGNNALAVATGNEFPGAFTGTVTVNKPGATITQNASKAIAGPLTLTAGTLDASATNYNLSLTGTWTNNSAAAAFTPRAGTVTFNGTSAQTIGGSFSTLFNGFTLSNSAGVSIALDEEADGTVTFNAGNLSIGTNNFIIGASAPAVAGTPSASSMIIASTGGTVRKLFSANGSFLYPVGDATNYSPITLSFTSGTYGAGAYAGVKVANVKHPANANVTDYLNRYWSIGTGGITSPVYDVPAATYVAGDVAGTETNLAAGQYAGVLPWIKYGATNTVTHSLTATGITGTATDISGITTAGPTVGAAAGGAICGGSGSTSLTAFSATGDPTLTYSWAPATGLSATTGTSITASPVATTTYTLTITDGNGFTGTATAVVSVNPSPAPITGTASFCSGTTTTLANTVTGGTWSSTNTAVATIDAFLGIATGVGPGTAVISYIAGGCYVTTIVTVNSAPAAITGPATVCPGTTSALSDIITGGAWTSSAAGTATVGSSSGVVTGVAAGVVTISYNTPGCFPVTYNMTVNPAPAVIIGLSSVCIGTNVTLTNASPGGSWLSSNPGVATIGSASGIVSGVTAGVATASYQLSATGCISTISISVNAQPLPITGGASLCVGGTLALSDPTAGGTWLSSNAGVATVGSSTGSVTGVLLGPATITYKLTGSGCYVTHAVLVNPPAGPVSGDSSVCVGTLLALTNPVTGGNWTSSNITIANVGISSGIVNGISSGIINITYTTGCSPVVFPVTVNPLPLPIAGTLHLCDGQSSTLADGSPSGVWNSSNPSAATIDSFSGAATGVMLGTATITYTLPTGCITTTSVTVNPLAPIMGQDSVCKGAVSFVSNIVGSGTWASSNPAIASINATSGMVTGLDSGISFIVYTLPSGCFDSLLLYVLPNLPAISGSGHICTGSVATLTDAVGGGTWSSDNLFAATIGASTGVLSALSPDTAHITYTWQYGCTTTRTIKVTPLPTPVISYSSSSNSLSTFGYYTSYQWYCNSLGVMGSATTAIIADPAFTDSFFVVVTDTNGCTGTSPKFFQQALGVNNYSAITVHIFPNPATDVVNITSPVQLRAVIRGIDGKTEMELENASAIDIRSLSSGIYFISLYDNSGQMITVQKLVKE